MFHPQKNSDPIFWANAMDNDGAPPGGSHKDPDFDVVPRDLPNESHWKNHRNLPATVAKSILVLTPCKIWVVFERHPKKLPVFRIDPLFENRLLPLNTRDPSAMLLDPLLWVASEHVFRAALALCFGCHKKTLWPYIWGFLRCQSVCLPSHLSICPSVHPSINLLVYA